jgi:pimeloyl-ACP methyl ester carboxylesterase
MGGAIASVLAARYPDRILLIWLLAPGGVKTPQPSEREQLLERGINTLVPNAKTIVMKGIGHVPMLEDPELTAKYYLEFQNKR